VSADHHREVVWLVRDGGVEGGQLSGCGRPVDRSTVREAVASRRVGRPVPAATAGCRGSRARVAREHLEQGGGQRGVQERFAFGHRVGHARGRTTRVVGGQTQGVEVGFADERVGHHLGEPGAGEAGADAAAQSLRGRQAATGRSGRQHRGHLVVPDDPCDLLDQVVRVRDVGAPARWRHVEGLGRCAVDGAADVAERTDGRGDVDLDAGHPRRQVGRDGDRGPGRHAADDGHSRLGPPTTQGHQQSATR
jgi:hypothetical protein